MKKTSFLLLKSAISLLICVSMLIGTTLAWFTDMVTSKNNSIVAGNLDVEFEYLNDNGSWKQISKDTNVFKENALWEPGYTEIVYLRIRNAGNLALKYSLGVRVASEKGSVNVYGEKFLLSDYIHFGVIKSDDQISPFSDRNKARQALDKTIAIKQGYTTEGFLSSADKATDKQRSETYIALVVYIPESVGNEANHIKGVDAPKINLGLSLVATQGSFEQDSFGSDYDAEAPFPEFNFPSNTFNESVSASAEVDGDGRLTQSVYLSGSKATADIPSGVLLSEGYGSLTLSVKEKLQSEADLTIESNESLRSLDVHIEGISEHNTVPMSVTLKEAVPKGLNSGNLSLYHVENGTAVKMIPVDQNTAFSAHNQFKYDPASGDLVLYIASFSEIAFVADRENAWNGTIDTEWYSDTESELYISNADQLAGLGALVSGGNSFSGKTVTLLSDVNMGGKDTVDSEGKLAFYPIGYNENGYQSAFSGIFDGAGHTVSNIFQSTWMLRGGYGNGYYNEAMGLFGYVYEGTVKNLTVSIFVSEGEFAPTGCVATYAANATFENIAIKKCHPQTYNTSVSAVVGRDGKNGCTLTFRNITVDSSNTVSALWGSWDVGAAGLLGYLGPDSKVTLDNCHVSATIDVYNDVCGNYQYYWYRYCGMLIGTVDKTQADGSLDLSNVTATGCTVNFGDRHEYFYCEDVDNSIASYTHDYQFSRIPHSELSFTDSNGNGIVDTNEVSSVIGCKHDHVSAGSEIIDGKEVLKEDKQAVHIPFYQLFGGYGWGVDGIDLEEYNDLQINVDRRIETGLEESVDKFLPNNGITNLESGKTYKLGDLFSAIEGVSINSASVTVGITDKNKENTDTVRVNFNLDPNDWTQSTVTFTGSETVDIIIQDYSFCNPAVLYDVQIVEPNILINTEEFLYGSYFDHDRVGHNNRILSVAYGLIRSADALLPAQDITIKVTNADTTNYNVTLGYFDKDGNYTGRNGIIPMINGEVSFKANEIGGAYFRVNVYIYNGSFTKVPEDAVIVVYGAEGAIPDIPTNPDVPVDPDVPTDPDVPEKPDPEKPWSGKKITIVGDSISTGGYVGTLSKMTGATIQNLSVSGMKLVGGITGKMQSIDADSDLIIIFGGTNDYWHKNTAIGNPDSPNTFVGALKYIWDYLNENHPDAEYLFVFPPNQTFGGNPSSTDFGYGTLDDFRAAFLDFCDKNNVQHVNLAETDFDPAKHSGDGVHPNSAGHQIIAEAIYGKISTGAVTTVVKRNVRLLPNSTSDLPEGALASAPGVVFNTAPYAYTDTNRFAGKHITRIGIPVKSVKALDENQTFTLSVVKTTSNAYEYVSQHTLTLPLEQLGEFTTVNKWIYVDVDITLGQDETLAFGMPTDTVEWGYSRTNDRKYNFRSSTGSWSNVIKESIIFDVYAAETLEFKNTEHGFASVKTEQVFQGVLSDFPTSSIPGGNDVEFTYPPYSYLNQNLFSNSRITKIGIPVKRVQALDENQTFTLFIIKKGSGSYQYVEQITLKLPLDQLGDSTTVNKWIYLDLDITLGEDETLAFGGKNDTVIWAWKSGYPDTTYSFRDANGGSTKGIFFDIYKETVLTYADYQNQLREEEERLEAERERERIEAELKKELADKGISILGDSISTFTGWSNNTSYNSTIGGNAIYYNGSTDGFSAVNETWWMQSITRSGLDLVVNNSWSGDCVTVRGISRSQQLHNNEGRNPDIIAVYLGINDFRTKVTVEDFAAAYEEMINGMLRKYVGSDVYLFTLLYTTNVSSGVDPANVVEFNEVIRDVASRYNCTLVDIYNDTGITPDNLATYMGDKRLHPNYAGMDLITDCFMNALIDKYVTNKKTVTDVIYDGRVDFDKGESSPTLELKVSYSDGSVEYVDITNDMYVTDSGYSIPDFSTVGSYKVKVEYQGFTVTFNLYVTDPDDCVLIPNEEFLYGSYFDHTNGNTDRVTSGAYGLIRSADALLPAQDITIKVNDTNLTNYKVTLGYYDANGNYKGKTGILSMVNGTLTIKASEMSHPYFRVNVYIYNPGFVKVPESAEIVVYGKVSDLPENQWEDKKITIVGDSISTGGYVGTLGNMTGASIQNLSKSGVLLTGGITSSISGIDADSDLIIIFGGTNDYWHKNTAIGNPDSPNTFVGALKYIWDYLNENHPDAEYLFVFPPNQTFGGNPSSTDFGYGTLDDFRAAFLDFCDKNNVQHINLAETDFDPAKHSGDGVHPNSAGHGIIAEAIYAAINKK